MNVRTMLSAAVLAVGLGSFALADMTGKVSFEGKAPERKKINMAGVPQCAAQHKVPVLEESIVVDKDGGLANVVISLRNPPAGGKVPAEPAMLDQKACQYIPHVLPMMVGQKILVKNSDPFLHNVHGLPDENRGFNFGQNNVDQGKAVEPMKVAEYFRVKCDVHPWMSAFFAVFPHPYFTATKADGTFEMKNVADGNYDVIAWHEKLGEKEGKVAVKGGKGEVTFTFSAEDSADASKAIPVITLPVSIKTEGCETECCDKVKEAKAAPVAAK